MADNLPDEFRRISTSARRIARLAHLHSPAIILLDAADLLVRRAEELCRAAGVDPTQHRAAMAEIRAAPLEPMTPDEIAEMEAEERRYAEADEAARKTGGYSEVEWSRLDHGYRFDLVMQHYPEGQHG